MTNIILSELEKTILSNVYKQYKYIVRNSDGKLILFKNKPEKFYECGVWWDPHMKGKSHFPFQHLFKFIKWTQYKPYLINDLVR